MPTAELPSLALPLLGVIDLVEEDGTPVDYKTVASTPDASLESWLHELQLTAYSLLVEEATGEPIPGNELKGDLIGWRDRGGYGSDCHLVSVCASVSTLCHEH